MLVYLFIPTIYVFIPTNFKRIQNLASSGHPFISIFGPFQYFGPEISTIKMKQRFNETKTEAI
jgi:hypothetical protein